jgi:hypothetical protein
MCSMTGKIVSLKSLSVFVENDVIFSLLKENSGITLVAFDNNLEIVNKVATFKGMSGFILEAKNGSFLIGIDDKLFLVSDGVKRMVLKTSNPANFFWHATRARNRLFVHEYGESPTGIFTSENSEIWKKLVTNIDIDKHSRHFHCLKYDYYRDWLIAVLGDGCLNKVVYSTDLGINWEILYRGLCQFAPVEVLRTQLVFGMDSGIARGGVGIYRTEIDQWEFIFLKWLGKKVRFAQICDLKKLKNGFWVATLGSPQVIMVSEDLKLWHPLYIEAFSKHFNHHMAVTEGRDFIACSTGSNLLLFEKKEIDLASETKTVMLTTKACVDRLRGLGFNFKHSF